MNTKFNKPTPLELQIFPINASSLHVNPLGGCKLLPVPLNDSSLHLNMATLELSFSHHLPSLGLHAQLLLATCADPTTQLGRNRWLETEHPQQRFNPRPSGDPPYPLEHVGTRLLGKSVVTWLIESGALDGCRFCC